MIFPSVKDIKIPPERTVLSRIAQEGSYVNYGTIPLIRHRTKTGANIMTRRIEERFSLGERNDF